LAEDLIRRGATQERGFRFCIKRFENLALCPELAVPKAYFDPMTDISIKELDSQPFSSDQIVRFLKAAPTSATQMADVAVLLRDHERCIYDWQNYLLWQLFVYKKYSDPDLILIARRRAIREDRPADRAGAILYLGAMGSSGDRYLLSESFKSCTQHLVQRNALIAVHEVEFNAGIKQHVAEHVIPSLVGTYRRLRNGFLGQYHSPLPLISAINIYDEVSSYD
jgi:hypothetical protein